ncbi:hypothetical protein [Sphingobacterium siyangense]|uniref:hypothetical protein n=1 Tax=Sphingobacterium siyangense TaxID=459529 RepID=UPI002FD9AD67
MANQFLVKNTMADMRALSASEITALQNGTYEGVELLGYYEKGDTPNSIIYFLAPVSPDPGPDDGGSVIAVQAIKLKHRFIEEVDLKYYGIFDNNTDISIDGTRVLGLLASKFLTAVFSGKNYLVDATKNSSRGILIPSNASIRTAFDTTFVCSPNASSSYGVISIIGSENVSINRLKIIGDREDHMGTAGEWGVGLNILSSKNVSIEEVVVNNCWGDGIYLGKTAENFHNYNITLKTVLLENNRRNGLTIITVDGYYSDSIRIKNTNGTDPQRGLDMEPNNATDVLKNIYINSMYTSNNLKGGFIVYTLKLNNTSQPCNIVINNWTSVSEPGLYFQEIQTTGKLKGFLEINNPKFINTTDSAIYFHNTSNNMDVFINNPTIYDCHDTPIKFIIGSPQVQTDGRQLNCVINNAKIYQYTENVSQAVVMYNSVVEDKGVIRGVTINGLDSNFANKTIAFLSDRDSFIDVYKFTLNEIPQGDYLLTKSSFAKRIINKTDSTLRTNLVIGKQAWWLNTPITLYNTSVATGIGLKFSQGGYLLGFDGIENNAYQISSDTKNSYITIECVDNVLNLWRIVDFMGVWYLNQGPGNPAYVIDSGAKQYEGSTYIAGVVRKSLASTDAALAPSTTYSQSEVQGILTELRDLKVKLRAAGILAN